MALAFNYDGDSYFTLQYNGDGLDTAQGLDKAFLQPPPDCVYFCYFNSGQQSGLVDGVVLTGQTSAAKVKIIKLITTSGTTGGSDALGVAFIQKVSGEIIAGENLRVSTTTYCIAGSAAMDAPTGMQARSLFVEVETNSIRFACGGAVPTSSTGTPASFGVILQTNENIVISGWQNVKTFQMIHAVAASNAKVNVIVNY